MVASSCTMSATMCSRAMSSITLISVSSRRRARGVRRSCEMPASITLRSCSSLASFWAMRLKPMFTSRISLVTTSSSRWLAAKSPSLTRLAAYDSCLSGRLISRAMAAAPASDSAPAVMSQMSQVRPPAGLKRERSISSQLGSPLMLKPTHTPLSLFTLWATMVSGPRRRVSSSVKRLPSAPLSSSVNLSPGSRGRMRTPSWSAMVLMSETRAIASACTSAARLRLTSEAICCAVCSVRGSNSSSRSVCSQARMLPTSSTPSRKKVRQNRFRPTRLRGSRRRSVASSGAGLVASGSARRGFGMERATTGAGVSARAVRHEDVAHTPHGLDVAWRSSVVLDQLAQARDLHVQAAVEGLELAPAGQQREFFARQRLARVAHQVLEHGELARGQRQFFAVLLQHARAEVESEGAKAHHLVLARGGAGGFLRRTTAQHGVDAGQQFAWVEGLAQVVVGAHFQAHDAVHVLALGGEHDDGCAVVGGTQAAADREAVFAGHHQVQHDQIDRVAQQDAVERLAVFGQDDFQPLLGEVAAQQ